VTVTDRRIVFHGPEDRTEWPLDRLIRLEHARRRPVSLLHVAGRRGVFGLLYRTPDAAPVRTVLELAAAGAAPAGAPDAGSTTGSATGSATSRAAGSTAGSPTGGGAVLASLAADRHRHALDRPRPPWPVSPDQAPGPTALVRRSFRALRASQARHRPRWRLTQAALAVLAMAAAAGVMLPHRPAPPSAGELAAAATSSPAAPPAAPAPVVSAAAAAGVPPLSDGPPSAAADTGRAPRTGQACRVPEQSRGPRACRLAASAPAGHRPGPGARGHRDPFRTAYLRAAALDGTPLWALDSPGRHAWVTGPRTPHPWAGRSRGRCHGHHHGYGSRPPDRYRASHRVAN
jgi:hypothetical protein